MARRWMGVALLAGWLGLSVPVQAQFPPAPPGSPGVDAPPPGAGPGAPPGYGFPPGAGPMPAYPGPEMSPPSLEGPSAPAECLPPNGFSNVHPERVGLVPQFSLEADFLYWWVRRMQVPPLVTTGSLKDALPGALGEPGTGLLIGGTEGPSRQSGGRLSALYWFGQAHEWGVEANAFILTGATSNVGVINGGDPSSSLVLARPFLNPNTGSSDADPIAIPGVQGGALNISMPRRFYGGDLNVRYSECLDVVVWSRITFLGGVRYLNLNEQLLIQEYVTDVPDAFGNPGNLTNLVDNFETRNRFYGGQLGMELESRVGPVVVTLLGKVAVGQTQQQITISGGSSVTEPDGTVTVDNARGLLVQPTNMGRFTRNQIGVVPELALTMAWEFNEHVKMSLAYNFLYWSNVVRPGDQIDTTVNVGAVGDPGQLGSSPHPVVPFQTSGFWAQGITAGITLSF